MPVELMTKQSASARYDLASGEEAKWQPPGDFPEPAAPAEEPVAPPEEQPTPEPPGEPAPGPELPPTPTPEVPT